MIPPDSKKRIEALTDSELEYEISRGDKSRFQRDKFTYLKENYQQRKRAKADTASKSYIRTTIYLLLHNSPYQKTITSLGVGTVSSWYGVWNLNYDNLVNTGKISIQTKQQIVGTAPYIIVAVALLSFLILNRYFLNKYKDPSKLSEEELNKLLKYL
jgi:hypothetical protein